MKALTSEDLRKLRIDAENVLTWPPDASDPLLFAHTQRFARAIIELLNDMKLIVDNLSNYNHDRFCGAWNNYPEDCNCSYKEANEVLRRLLYQP